MAKLHWAVYLAAGLFVSIVSWIIGYEKLIFFFYAGLVFTAVGIAKMVMSGLAGKKEGKTDRVQMHQAHQMSRPHSAAHHNPSNAHHPHVRYCRKCGNAVRASDRFCGRCGGMM